MKRFLFGAVFLVFMGYASSLWAADCSRFVSDYREGKVSSSKAYSMESDQMYVPSKYCAFSPMTIVLNQSHRVEFYTIEQCSQTRYKPIKTTMVCVEDPKLARVRSSCDVEGHLISPCRQSDLADVLAKNEAVV